MDAPAGPPPMTTTSTEGEGVKTTPVYSIFVDLHGTTKPTKETPVGFQVRVFRGLYRRATTAGWAKNNRPPGRQVCENLGMTTTATDLDLLRDLNQSYLDSVRTGDVERFRQLLADDFQCSTPAGELLDKAQFLERTAGPRTLERLTGEDVRIRILGDVAIIHAATSFTSVTGQNGRGRYTDDWQKRNGTWVCVSAHVTRL